jgi:hypothetical protein
LTSPKRPGQSGDSPPVTTFDSHEYGVLGTMYWSAVQWVQSTLTMVKKAKTKE